MNNMKEEIYKHAFPTEGTQIREIAVEATPPSTQPKKSNCYIKQTDKILSVAYKIICFLIPLI